ncbi:MAG: Metallo-beta-lactamase L1 precursor [Candidatus Accumulibacter sp. BA-94]|nr:MAG: Metallo-beta-lactamase L1 precursor [Candidatus Accumulibacter sp. BA-94]
MGPQTRFITSEICQVGGPGQTDQSDAAIYLVHVADSAVLIDAGSGRASERVLMNIEAAGVQPEQVEALLLTHCHYDHSGGAAGFRRRFGWQVAIHELEADWLEAGDSQVSAACLAPRAGTATT